jgi:hypothetical protein
MGAQVEGDHDTKVRQASEGAHLPWCDPDSSDRGGDASHGSVAQASATPRPEGHAGRAGGEVRIPAIDSERKETVYERVGPERKLSRPSMVAQPGIEPGTTGLTLIPTPRSDGLSGPRRSNGRLGP